MNPPPTPPLPPPPPPRRPATAVRARRSGGGTWLKLLLVVTGLLVAAAWIGRPRPAAEDMATETEANAPADDSRPAPSAPVVLKAQGDPAQAHGPVQDARFSVNGDGTVLHIDGGVGMRFASDLKAALDGNPSLRRVVITSGGGYAGPGLEAARLIRRNNLTIRVKSHCASMCVGLWAAAAARELEADAVIGLHQWRAPCGAMPPAERRECEYSVQFMTQHDAVYDSWLRSAGFSARLLALQASTSADDLAVLTAPQLWDEGVDFVAVDGEGRRLSRAQALELLAARYGGAGRG